jgi:outer membrane immunogenic protein
MVGYWSGFYVGAQAGFGWGKANIPWAVNPPYTNWQPAADQNGAIGGLHIGYNHQIGSYLLGIEADAERTSQRGKDGDNDPNAVEQTRKGSIRARVGFVTGSTLFYTTAGVAFLNADATREATSEKVGTSYTGWTLGAGTEYALSRNWSARAEYRYEDFGHTDMAFAGYGMRVTPRTHGIRLGVSYRFGG